MATNASFQLDKYIFDSVFIDLVNKTPSQVKVNFEPSGEFDSAESTYDLKFVFFAFSTDNEENPFVKIQCHGIFKFQNVTSIEEIPGYFYRNAIAILFPYVRAFISTVTLQANIQPLILPTYNLSELEHPLKKSTTLK